MVSIVCFVCGSNKWKELHKDLVECEFCGFVRAGDKYFIIDFKTIYTDEYFNGLDYADYKGEKRALKKNFSNRLERILKYKPEGELLEIGVAYGYFLALAEEYFSAVGIDLDKEVVTLAKENASRSRIIAGDFSKARVGKSRYDVVCMFDVIEHLKDPLLYVRKISLALKSGGIVVIETGDIGAYWARFRGSNWRLITPPTHLSYFSRDTLVELLEREGFSILEVAYPGVWRTFRQLFFRIGFSVPTFLSNVVGLPFYLNTRDIMMVVAKKD